MTWKYDKEQLMWRRDLNVRVIFSPLRGWIAVHSLKGRLGPEWEDAETAKAYADKAWPVDGAAPPQRGIDAEPDDATYIWPPPPRPRGRS